MLAVEQLETGGTTMEPATRFDKPWLFDWLADGNKPRLSRSNTPIYGRIKLVMFIH